MWEYTLLMFAVSALFFIFAVLIYRGRIDLIHDYHRKKVKDKHAYGRDMGKALLWFAVSPLLSGAAALLGTSKAAGLISAAILLTGFAIGFLFMLQVQKRHNGGLF